MRKTFTLILGLLLVSVAFAEKPVGVIMKASVDPKVDGVLDEVWKEANVYDIDKNYRTELPTLGEPGQSTWRGLWVEKGVYIFLTVKDNDWYPSYESGGNSWEYDKPEVYFDVNYVLEDGLGVMHGKGHYQFAPAAVASKIDGTPTTESNGVIWAFKVDNPSYTVEYFIPFTVLKDKDDIGVDLTGVIGFDVTLIDRDHGDPARKRAVWANIGTFDESWSNMDEAGLITFDGAEPPIYIEKITLGGGNAITVDNGTLQIVATILPEDASNKVLKWKVESAPGSKGKATVSSDGLVTAVMDGVVIVTASATDGSYEDATIEITISGQKPTLSELNLIKNGYFDEVDATGSPAYWGGWVDGGYGETWTVADGVAVLGSTQAHPSENWHYQFNQSGLTASPNIPYILKFKAWADNDRNICVDFEDTSGNGYNRYGSTTDPRSSNGRSEWTWKVTTEPTWYTFDVVFDQMVPSTVQKVQFMISQATGTVYLDSIYLISQADLELIGTNIKQNTMETFRVYPNPAVSKLHVDISTPNTVVAIYNSVGIKMEEVVVTGTHHMFDVSRYTKGLYFVKANNQVIKFVK